MTVPILSTATAEVIAQITTQIETRLAAVRDEAARLERVLAILQEGPIDGAQAAAIIGRREGRAKKTTRRATKAPKAARKTLPTNPQTLPVVLAGLLEAAKGEPRTTDVLTAGARAAGYVTTSKTFRNVVYMALKSNPRRFRRNRDGAWTLARKGGAE